MVKVLERFFQECSWSYFHGKTARGNHLKNTGMEKYNTPESMNTSSEILEKLRLMGMDNEFRWTPEGFTTGNGRYYQPGELEILRSFRFEGVSNPSDMEILYIIRTKDGFIGYSQDAYGAYSSHENEEGYDNFIRQVPQAGHEQQLLFEL